jgi:hypothetical protein
MSYRRHGSVSYVEMSLSRIGRVMIRDLAALEA